MSDFIYFLGTGGARVTVGRQLRNTGGVWLSIAGKNILIDPGPGAIYHANAQGFDLNGLDAVILSHNHIDHSNDANAAIESMACFGKCKKGVVLAPAECLELPEPVIFSHFQKYPERIETLVANGKYEIGGVKIRASIRHKHPSETYGFVFERPAGDIAFITDTDYFPEVLESYTGAETVVANVVMYERINLKFIQHLCFFDVEEIIATLKPKRFVMTHFGKLFLDRDIDALAAELSQKTGIEVIAATDRMKITL